MSTRVNLTGIYSTPPTNQDTLNWLKNEHRIAINNGCCMGLKMPLTSNKLVLIYPTDWLPKKYQTEEKVKEVINYILSISTHLKFVDFVKLSNKFIEQLNIVTILNNGSAQDVKETESCVVKNNNFMVFEIRDSGKIETYYNFCLVRAVCSTYYQDIVLNGLELTKEGLDPFTALQLAHYTVNPIPLADKFLFQTTVSLVDFKEFKKSLKDAKGLNINFKALSTTITLEDLRKEIKEKKYNDVIQRLK